MSKPVRATRVEPFYLDLQQRVEAWLGSEEARRFPCAHLYRFLPSLYLFLVRVAVDARVPARERSAASSVLKYIVSPYDLIPEAVFGTSGFRDDLVLAALMVDRLHGLVEPQVLAELWQAPGDPQVIAHTILDASSALVGPELCGRLRAWLPE
jgi:uncharacterized membrane protein YkvA (DUF1232 family)